MDMFYFPLILNQLPNITYTGKHNLTLHNVVSHSISVLNTEVEQRRKPDIKISPTFHEARISLETVNKAVRWVSEV